MTTPITKEQFTKEQLIAKAREQIEFCRQTKITGEGRTHVNQCLALFEIALAAMDAEPYGFTDGDGYGMLYEPRHKDRLNRPRPLYAAPPEPVVPDEMAISDDMNLYQKSFAQGHNACRAAMLNHSEVDRDMVEPVSQAYKLPATRFQQVADLYGILVPGGRTTTYSTDAAEASDCRVMGWSVQEYVKLERLQDALTGNSPVIPDRLNVRAVAALREAVRNQWLKSEDFADKVYWKSMHDIANEIVSAMLAAAPQQERK